MATRAPASHVPLVTPARPGGLGLTLRPDFRLTLTGETGTNRLLFWAADDLPALSAGERFELREGARVVGHGQMLEVR